MSYKILKYSGNFDGNYEWQYQLIFDNEWNKIWDSADEYIMNTILVNYDDDLIYLDREYDEIKYEILSFNELSKDEQELVIQILIKDRKAAQRRMLDIENILEEML